MLMESALVSSWRRSAKKCRHFLTLPFRQFKTGELFFFYVSYTFPFFLHLHAFRGAIRDERTFFSSFLLAIPFFLLFSPTRAFLILKPRRVLRCPHKSDKRKATRLLNVRVNVNNDNGSATRERETESKWGVGQELGGEMWGRTGCESSLSHVSPSVERN